MHCGPTSNAVVPLGMGYKFKCSQNCGALLVLNQPAKLDEIHTSKSLREYMIRNHESWCDFALKQFDLLLRPEEIILVRGSVKTSEWAVAAFMDRGSSHELELYGIAGHLANASFSVSVSCVGIEPVSYRSGPSLPRAALGEETGRGHDDQCVFLQAYKIKQRLRIGPRFIQAAGEPSGDLDESCYGSPSSGSLVMSVSDLGASFEANDIAQVSFCSTSASRQLD